MQSTSTQRRSTPIDLIRPGMVIDESVEAALFGSALRELGGVEPELVDVSKIQHRLVLHVLTLLPTELKQGRREDLKSTLLFVKRALQEQLLGILQTVIQERFDRSKKVKEKTGVWEEFIGYGRAVEAKQLEEEAYKVDQICSNIATAIRAVYQAIDQSFLIESDLPEDIRQAHLKIQEITQFIQMLESTSFNLLVRRSQLEPIFITLSQIEDGQINQFIAHVRNKQSESDTHACELDARTVCDPFKGASIQRLKAMLIEPNDRIQRYLTQRNKEFWKE